MRESKGTKEKIIGGSKGTKGTIMGGQKGIGGSKGTKEQ